MHSAWDSSNQYIIYMHGYTYTHITNNMYDLYRSVTYHFSFYRNYYFAKAAANKKGEFISQLSASFQLGGLTCSFKDKELIQLEGKIP